MGVTSAIKSAIKIKYNKFLKFNAHFIFNVYVRSNEFIMKNLHKCISLSIMKLISYFKFMFEQKIAVRTSLPIQ